MHLDARGFRQTFREQKVCNYSSVISLELQNIPQFCIMHDQSVAAKSLQDLK